MKAREWTDKKKSGYDIREPKWVGWQIDKLYKCVCAHIWYMEWSEYVSIWGIIGGDILRTQNQNFITQ